MAKVIWKGPAKPDDPIYKTGLVIGGKRLEPSSPVPKASKKKSPR